MELRFNELPRLLIHLFKVQHKVLGACADADFRPSDAQARRDVVLRSPAGVAAPALFKNGVRDPGNRPDLSAVRVAAELEIDSGR